MSFDFSSQSCIGLWNCIFFFNICDCCSTLSFSSGVFLIWFQIFNYVFLDDLLLLLKERKIGFKMFSPLVLDDKNLVQAYSNGMTPSFYYHAKWGTTCGRVLWSFDLVFFLLIGWWVDDVLVCVRDLSLLWGNISLIRTNECNGMQLGYSQKSLLYSYPLVSFF